MKRFPIILVVFFSSLMLFGQKVNQHHEISGGIGTTNYFGDIGGSTADFTFFGLADLDLKSTRFSAQGAYRYIINAKMAAKVSLYYGLISGSDSLGGNVGRGIKFNTNLLEYMASFEYYFVEKGSASPEGYAIMQMRQQMGNKIRVQARPYFFWGVGGIYYKPEIIYNPTNRGVVLDKNSNMVLAFGGGAKLEVNSVSLAVELGGRWTFTDYIDGYSKEYEDNPQDAPAFKLKSPDLYYLMSVSMTYTLDMERWIRDIKRKLL